MRRKSIWMTFMLFVCTLAFAQEDKMIREDRVWEYFSYEYKANYTECALERYGFTDTMEYNGHTYQLCELLSRTTWRTPDGVFSDVLMAEDVKEESVGVGYHYLRQEGSKVYLFVDPLWESFHYSPAPYDEVTSFDPISTPDMLLFDFSASKGDIIKSVMNSYDQFVGMVLTQAEVVDTEDVKIGSTAARRLKLSNISGTNWDDDLTINIDSEWLEGVGNIGKGGMLLFGGVQWPEPDCYCGHGGHFNNLYDLDGNVIYKGADIRIGSNGVNAVASDSGTGKSDKIYDLMGRRMERVLHGSVYVRDGKKFVGK